MNARRSATTTTVAALLAATLTLAALASATTARKTTGPVVLRLAARDSGLGGDPALADFVNAVGRLSGGALRIDVLGGWGNSERGAEQQIVRDVAAGKADLGAIGTRVMDTLGIRSFQALTAPMLIDNYRLERAVITSEIPDQMLEGLGRVRLSGLAVLGEGLRKPVAVQRPLLGPADWHGITFAVFRSRAAAAAVRALGARPTDLWGDPLSSALTAGRVQGAENDLLVYYGNSRQYQAPYVTANVNLWPRTEVLLANPDRLSRLTSEQQAWLHQAAAAAALHSTGLADHDSKIARALCRSGAHFATASADELTALRQAFKPVYRSLEQNPQTRTFIARIEQLKRSTPSGSALTIPAGCRAHAKKAG